MFQKIKYVSHPPLQPTMIWDGNCGFCKYWILHWKSKTGDNIQYIIYQHAASEYTDIPVSEFKKASRFIETDGTVYAGPDSAYKSLSYYQNPIYFPHRWYEKYQAFRWLSDYGYNFIAKNRPFMMRLTVFAFGKNPTRLKPYWLIWLVWLLVMSLTLILQF